MMIKCPNCEKEIENKAFLNFNMATVCPSCGKNLMLSPSIIFLFLALLIFGLLWDTLPFFTNLPGGWSLRYILTFMVAVILIIFQISIGYGKVNIIKPKGETTKP